MIVVKLPGVAPPVTSDKKATVPVPFWNVIVLSAVGSTTVNVVSYASAVAPSNTIELSVNVKPETEGDVIVLFVKVSVVALPTNVSAVVGKVNVLPVSYTHLTLPTKA